MKTHTGWAYFASVIDVFSRRVVGRQASISLRSDLAIDALEVAVYASRDQNFSNLVHCSDRGVQCLLVRHTELLEQAGAIASVGSKGDSYEIALAEKFNGIRKTEVIHRRGPRKNADDVEWFNDRRIQSSLDDLTPTQFETHF